ncbi:MAG: NAD(P)H-dependent oxidoreductase subunit E [bacterium]
MDRSQAPPLDTQEPNVYAHPSGDSRFTQLDDVIDRENGDPDSLIQILHAAQGLFGYLSDDVIVYISRRMRVSLSQIYGVATFYHFFTTIPRGKHTCMVCTGTACYVRGADRLVARLTQEFGVEPGHTTPDGLITLQTARCIGACGLAPAVVLDEDVLGNVKVDKLLRQLKKLK